MKIDPTIPRMVVLHDQQPCDPHQAWSAAGLRPPFTVFSYTDTHPNSNVHNNKLSLHVYHAEMLLVQKRLIDLSTEAAKRLVNAAFLSSNWHQLFVFEEGSATEVDLVDMYDQLLGEKQEQAVLFYE